MIWCHANIPHHTMHVCCKICSSIWWVLGALVCGRYNGGRWWQKAIEVSFSHFPMSKRLHLLIYTIPWLRTVSWSARLSPWKTLLLLHQRVSNFTVFRAVVCQLRFAWHHSPIPKPDFGDQKGRCFAVALRVGGDAQLEGLGGKGRAERICNCKK